MPNVRFHEKYYNDQVDEYGESVFDLVCDHTAEGYATNICRMMGNLCDFFVTKGIMTPEEFLSILDNRYTYEIRVEE